MKVIFVQNCIFNGMRFAAGDVLEVTESQIKELGILVKKSGTTSEPKSKQETKAAATRTAAKAAPKTSIKATAKKK